MPLTEPSPYRAPVAGVTPATIAAIVDEFYRKCRLDPLLGPVFTRHISNWDTHLVTMRSFWSAAILRTGGYSGRPHEAHLGIPGLTHRHFERWLTLFEETVREQGLPAADAEQFMTLARRMAAHFVAARTAAGSPATL